MYQGLQETPLAQQPVEVTKPSVENEDTEEMIEVRQRVCDYVRL
jgi:hypothetical protein